MRLHAAPRRSTRSPGLGLLQAGAAPSDHLLRFEAFKFVDAHAEPLAQDLAIVLSPPWRSSHDPPRGSAELAGRARHPHLFRCGMVMIDEEQPSSILVVLRHLAQVVYREAWD